MPSLPLAGKRAGPWGTGWENWSCSPPGTVHRRVGNYLTWSATPEMVGCRWGGVRAGQLPLPSLVCHMMTKIREICSLTKSLTACDRQESQSGGMRTEEWALTFTKGSNQKRGPCTLPGQTTELTLVVWVLVSWARGCGSRIVPLLLSASLGELAHVGVRVAWLVTKREAGRLISSATTQAYEPWGSPPNPLLIYGLLENVKGLDLQIQNSRIFIDTRQQ